MRSRRTFGLGLLAAAAVILATPHADACGGTFCNTGGNPQLAIDQTGENIIFVMEPGQVEAHIQIQYQGAASSFSWVLPVQALPEIEVGSQALFDRLLAGTVPTYGYTTQQDFCGNFNATGTGGSGNFASGAGGGGGSVGSADAGVSVVLQKTVGAFEVTVLQGGTTPEVLAWLTTNGYQAPTATPGLLDGYVANHYLFVAVKLTNGAGIDEIHPLVVRYKGTQPCVPLKLTAVAAVEDMSVRTFFMGTKRVVPKNYKHVVPNPVMLNWMARGANYKTLVGGSVDSPIANGRGFVTEYAGPTAVVGANPIASPQWNASPFASAAAVNVIKILQQQGFLQCYGMFCNYAHPLLLPLLRDYLPVPASLGGPGSGAEGSFYSCLAGAPNPNSGVSCDAATIDTQKWDAAKFASALSSRIIDPARHADSLIANWPYLTRMFTTISPLEMTEDPEFFEHDGLPDVRISGSGVQRIACNGASGMTLPDGRQVALTPNASWPAFSNQMPFAERIEEFPAVGASIVLVDNTERINAQLKAWNDSQGWPPPIPSMPSSGGATGGTGGAFFTGGGQGGMNVGNDVAGGGGGAGCSCRIGAPAVRRARLRATQPSGALALAGLVGLIGARRRKRN